MLVDKFGLCWRGVTFQVFLYFSLKKLTVDVRPSPDLLITIPFGYQNLAYSRSFFRDLAAYLFPYVTKA
jgi:hypothetical protein